MYRMWVALRMCARSEGSLNNVAPRLVDDPFLVFFGYHMFNKSFITVLIGFVSILIACLIFYFDTRSSIAYALFAIGFILVGIGILLGFFKMVSDNEE
jgi:hypothetical protein